MLPHVKRYAGGGAGAAAAALLAVGLSAAELGNELGSGSIQKLLAPRAHAHRRGLCLSWRPAAWQFYRHVGRVFELQVGSKDVTFEQLFIDFGVELALPVQRREQPSYQVLHVKTAPQCSIRKALLASLLKTQEGWEGGSALLTSWDGEATGHSAFPLHVYDGWGLALDAESSFSHRLANGSSSDFRLRFRGEHSGTLGLRLETHAASCGGATRPTRTAPCGEKAISLPPLSAASAATPLQRDTSGVAPSPGAENTPLGRICVLDTGHVTWRDRRGRRGRQLGGKELGLLQKQGCETLVRWLQARSSVTRQTSQMLDGAVPRACEGGGEIKAEFRTHAEDPAGEIEVKLPRRESVYEPADWVEAEAELEQETSTGSPPAAAATASHVSSEPSSASALSATGSTPRSTSPPASSAQRDRQSSRRRTPTPTHRRAPHRGGFKAAGEEARAKEQIASAPEAELPTEAWIRPPPTESQAPPVESVRSVEARTRWAVAQWVRAMALVATASTAEDQPPLSPFSQRRGFNHSAHPSFSSEGSGPQALPPSSRPPPLLFGHLSPLPLQPPPVLVPTPSPLLQPPSLWPPSPLTSPLNHPPEEARVAFFGLGEDRPALWKRRRTAAVGSLSPTIMSPPAVTTFLV